MIFGHINYIDEAANIYPEAIAKTLQYLAGNDLSKLALNDRHDIDGDNIFFNIVDKTTKPALECKPETHRKYLDVHFLMNGEEQVGVTTNDGSYKVTEDLYPAKDATFYENSMPDECLVRMKPGHFVIVFPEDIHRPLTAVNQPQEVRKAIVKIAVDCL